MKAIKIRRINVAAHPQLRALLRKTQGYFALFGMILGCVVSIRLFPFWFMVCVPLPLVFGFFSFLLFGWLYYLALFFLVHPRPVRILLGAAAVASREETDLIMHSVDRQPESLDDTTRTGRPVGPLLEDPPEEEDPFFRGFGGVGYRSGARYDGIPRSRYALTLESTYRLLDGDPDFYLTCAYRLNTTAMAQYMRLHAEDIGERLQRNKLIVPVHGREEEYWRDVNELLVRTTPHHAAPIRLSDTGVFFILATIHPQLMLRDCRPIAVFDIGKIGVQGINALISKIIDIFSGVEIDNGDAKIGRIHPIDDLLRGLCVDDGEDRDEIAYDLAELCLIIDALDIAIFNASWDVGALLQRHREMMLDDPVQMRKIRAIKTELYAEERAILDTHVSWEGMSRPGRPRGPSLLTDPQKIIETYKRLAADNKRIPSRAAVAQAMYVDRRVLQRALDHYKLGWPPRLK